MILERTISQLDVGHIANDRALELGHLGYMQWLGGLPASVPYVKSAQHALDVSEPFAEGSPAIAVYRALLSASIDQPLRPLDLILPNLTRRGGARARRAVF